MSSVHKRSQETKEKRKEKKKRRIRRKTSIIPYTGTDKKRFKPPYYERYVNYPFQVKDVHNGILIHFFKNTIPLDFIVTLETTTDSLVNQFSPPTDKTCRGEQSCYYFGYWRESSPTITMCPHTQNPAFKNWYKDNQLLFKFLGNLLKEYYPEMYQAYETIDTEYRMFGPWSMAILNIDSQSNLHIDSKDWYNGFCVVIAFGKDYIGGELHFPLLNVTLNIERMDAVLFQSHKLQHGNQDTIGTRHSLVLVSHNSLFNMKK